MRPVSQSLHVFNMQNLDPKDPESWRRPWSPRADWHSKRAATDAHIRTTPCTHSANSFYLWGKGPRWVIHTKPRQTLNNCTQSMGFIGGGHGPGGDGQQHWGPGPKPEVCCPTAAGNQQGQVTTGRWWDRQKPKEPTGISRT